MQKLNKQQTGLPNLDIHKKHMLKNLERKNNLGGYQKEKLYTLKMKNANKKMFVNNDLNQFMKDALDKKSRFEDDFGKSEKEENVTDVNER